ncbi:peroxidasin-like [Rhopilema esculentum]|uniref:peroxidasin-like n=1 Tax=Rhopilema esculentum TaxID=499914 RepID=UPI0031D436D6
MVKLTIRYNRLTNITNATFNGLASLEELFLNNNYISSFPSHIFRELSQLKKLSLGSNKIQRIEQGTFAGLDGVLELALSGNKLSELIPNGFGGLPNLRILTLEDNSIIKIHQGAFAGLKNVATLYLYRNQLSNIPSHAFKGLDRLTELNLGVNRIASIENEAFFGMPVLLSLSLNSNRLTVIPAHAFKGLALLQKLTLYFNRIRYVAEGAFAPLNGLNILSWNPPSSLMRFHPKLQTVQSNTLHCDCNAFWLRDWINSSKTLVHPAISCAAPERFKGKALMSIGKEDFPCDPSQVQVMPNRTYVLEGGSTSFKCTLLPGAVFTWVHNGKKIDVEDGDKYAAQQDGLLEINRISPEDEGTYICLAGNKAGSAAASATLSLGRTPVIIEQPEKEVTVATPEKSVLLPCKADGYPKPSIYWLKDGARVKFNERVMLSADGSLIILNMKHSDEGIYSCLAANTFGTKDVSVRLYLSQGSMCLPSCRRDSGYCIAKYECQCLLGFEGPACEFRNNKVKSVERTASNNSIDGKAARVPKQSSWVYDPLEMELDGGSGDDDTERDSDDENEKVVSDENSKVKLIINDHKPKKTRRKNVVVKLGTEVAPDHSPRPNFQLIIRRQKPVNKRLSVIRIGRSPRVHALTTKLLVHKLLPKGG